MKAFIYMIICLSFCSELIHCSCLSYGHSCWGAHGKRSSNDRTESEPQQDRWALFKLMQNENDKYMGREHIVRAPTDDSLDYNENKRLPNNLLDALRKRKLPLIIWNNVDDAVLPQEIQKSFAESNVRERRSVANGQNGVNNLQDMTTKKSSLPKYTVLSV